MCAIICGADNWLTVEEFGLAKEEWFTKLLGFKNDIPSHDTFGEVYAAIDTDQFSLSYSRCVEGVYINYRHDACQPTHVDRCVHGSWR
ncbi:MAG: transposase family protein [Methylococcaceae bacterium]|nr:transposase family protein [Methylococcaceae bacterium]MDP3020104.1 transposase family protein [Methylococcaceae bacterium]MDP3391178.1 transposase family protein [Methylococcaceae bacterium]MDP3932548.1 transposase family protein [Methylococcaceae bacterium]